MTETWLNDTMYMIIKWALEVITNVGNICMYVKKSVDFVLSPELKINKSECVLEKWM